MQSRPILAPLPLISLALLGGLLIATGSYSPGRAHSGPYVAGPGRRQEKALIALALALAGALLGYILYPEVITQRGASFRLKSGPTPYARSASIHGSDTATIIRCESS